MLIRAGNLAAVLGIAALLIILSINRFGTRLSWAVAMFALKDNVRGEFDVADSELHILEGAVDALDGDARVDETKDASVETADEASDTSKGLATDKAGDASITARRLFRKKLFTKLKIVVAAWQISAAAEAAFPQVQFPAVYAEFVRLAGIFGLGIFDIGTLDCVFGWSYLQKLVFVTVAPLLVVFLGAGLSRCYLLGARDANRVVSNMTYAALLFMYVCIPGISNYVITYFSCCGFDRGQRSGGPSDLHFVAAQLDFRCGGKRYRSWAVYDAAMIVLWPVGITVAVGLVLWRHRRQLNPDVPYVKNRDDASNIPGFAREVRRHETAMRELTKFEKRENDMSIAALEFLFEEYEPRCFLFPVFELARRLFLSSVVAVFYPGSSQQVVIAMFGAMLSYAVYAYFEPYMEDNDDRVSAVAQAQVVLTYFAAVVVYVSDETQQKQSVFSSATFGVFLVLVFLSSFMVAAYVILLDVFGHECLRRAWTWCLGALRRCLKAAPKDGTTQHQQGGFPGNHQSNEATRPGLPRMETSILNDPDAVFPESAECDSE